MLLFFSFFYLFCHQCRKIHSPGNYYTSFDQLFSDAFQLAVLHTLLITFAYLDPYIDNYDISTDNMGTFERQNVVAKGEQRFPQAVARIKPQTFCRIHLDYTYCFILFNHKLIIDILHTYQPQNIGSLSFALTYYTHDRNWD